MLETASLPLGLLSTVNLSAPQFERLRAIEEYDLWFVIERVERKGTIAPQLVDPAVAEFKRCMALAALGYTNLGIHSTVVDEVWHNFILFTREYGEFCEAACGQMIHHRPNTSLRPQLPPTSLTNFTEVYTKYFGPLSPIWEGHGTKRHPVSEHLSANDGDCDVAGGEEQIVLQAGDTGTATGECDTAGSDSLTEECDTFGHESVHDPAVGECDVSGHDSVAEEGDTFGQGSV